MFDLCIGTNLVQFRAIANYSGALKKMPWGIGKMLADSGRHLSGLDATAGLLVSWAAVGAGLHRIARALRGAEWLAEAHCPGQEPVAHPRAVARWDRLGG